MNYHWMSRYEALSPQNFIKLSNDLDFCGYKTWFTAYHSNQSDAWIKSINALNPRHKLKYIIPLRPYSISPEYCSMMAMAFQEIAPERLIIGMLPGGIQGDEKSLNLFVDDFNKFDTVSKRANYIPRWMEKFKQTQLFTKFPNTKIALIGRYDIDKETIDTYADYFICMYDAYWEYQEFFDKNKTIVSVSVAICENDEDVKIIEDHLVNTPPKVWTIYGSKQEIINRLNEIEYSGIKNVMLHSNIFDKKRHLVHEMVYELNFNKQIPKNVLEYDYTIDWFN